MTFIAIRNVFLAAIAGIVCAATSGCEQAQPIGEYQLPLGTSGRAFDCSPPSGWALAANDAFSKLAFEVGGDARSARITISSLSSGGGQLLPNVNRWRRQMGLGPTTEENLDNELTEITVDGVEGHFMELQGPAKALQGAIVEHGENVWFFKLSGDPQLVEAETEHFREFLKSFDFFE